MSGWRFSTLYENTEPAPIEIIPLAPQFPFAFDSGTFLSGSSAWTQIGPGEKVICIQAPSSALPSTLVKFLKDWKLLQGNWSNEQYPPEDGVASGFVRPIKLATFDSFGYFQSLLWHPYGWGGDPPIYNQAGAIIIKNNTGSLVTRKDWPGISGYSARPSDKTFFWSHDQYGRKIQASNESTYGVGISMPSITNTYERFTTSTGSGYGSPGLITE
jgi:hypothetical protein